MRFAQPLAKPPYELICQVGRGLNGVSQRRLLPVDSEFEGAGSSAAIKPSQEQTSAINSK